MPQRVTDEWTLKCSNLGQNSLSFPLWRAESFAWQISFSDPESPEHCSAAPRVMAKYRYMAHRNTSRTIIVKRNRWRSKRAEQETSSLWPDIGFLTENEREGGFILWGDGKESRTMARYGLFQQGPKSAKELVDVVNRKEIIL